MVRQLLSNESSEATLAGWGRRPVPGYEVRSEDLVALTDDVVLTRGLGRSYGDSSLPPPSQRRVACSTLADRILGFETETGLLRAEAGLSLGEINRIFWPRCFTSPVLPGTKYITLGGMVAADVHGKEHHHRGSFGEHVTELRLRVASGQIVNCSREQHPELFAATIGGMGLTGHILEVAVALVRIPSRWILQETERVKNVDEYIEALKRAEPIWPYTVGWIDCLSKGPRLGRGVLMKGRWAEADEAPKRAPRVLPKLTLPFEFPGWVLSRPFVRAFNFAFYHKPLAQGVVAPEPYFHPLDGVLHWNRAYGPRGFTQYQCVLPESAGNDAARRFLETLTQRGGASFLCVIKGCGAEGLGMLSFPMRGITIALDIAVRDGTQALIDALNEQVIGEGGRVYLAKDSFTRPEHYRAMEPRFERWQAIREQWDPTLRLRSAQSVRLFGDPE